MIPIQHILLVSVVTQSTNTAERLPFCRPDTKGTTEEKVKNRQVPNERKPSLIHATDELKGKDEGLY